LGIVDPVLLEYKGDDPDLQEFIGVKARMSALAKRKDLRFTTVYSRWKKAKSPAVVGDWLFLPADETQSRYMNKVGYTIDGVRYDNASKAGLAHDRGPTWIQRRFRYLGVRSATYAELVAVQECDMRYDYPAVPSRSKAKGKKLSDRSMAMDDPNYLPHIPFGDLSHLSYTRNTGAGKGEIENPTSFRSSTLASVHGLAI
jgi:hypothetical protein